MQVSSTTPMDSLSTHPDITTPGVRPRMEYLDRLQEGLLGPTSVITTKILVSVSIAIAGVISVRCTS